MLAGPKTPASRAKGFFTLKIFGNGLRGLLLLVIFMGVAPASRAQITLSTEQDGALAANQLHYFIDRESVLPQEPGRKDLDGQDWQAAAQVPVNLGFVQAPVWFRLQIHNPTDKLQVRYLQFSNPRLDTLDIHVYDGDTLKKSRSMGGLYPFRQRLIKLRHYTERLQIQPGATLDVMLKLETENSVQLPVSLWRANPLITHTERHSLLLGLYYGSLLVMLLYNLSIYINNRDKKYLDYVIYLASIGAFFACFNGLAFQYLWPRFPTVTASAEILFLSMVLFFGCQFTCRFLGLANTRPGLELTLRILALCAILVLLGSVVLPYSVIVIPVIILTVLVSAVGLAAGIIRWHDCHPAAMLFTLSKLVLTLGCLILAANKLGWIARTPLTENMAQVGSMLEFMILSLALIQQLNAERRAKTAAQQHALNFERQASQSREEALRVQRDATLKLELRVAQRTRELQALNEKLTTLSRTDPLTGLKNRRYLMEHFHAEYSRSKRDATPISVIIIDIDHFKSVNDTHGHLLGDELLKMVAHQIGAEAKRESDIAARYGGEEFAIVLGNNSADEALAIAEKIRARVAAAQYVWQGVSLRCTVSVGVATITPAQDSTAENLIRQSDEALYRSKAEGRNRVSVFRQEAA